MPPATLARALVRAGLNGGQTEAEKRRRAGLAALDRLAEITADLPPIDGVRIARESREELDSTLPRYSPMRWRTASRGS